MDGLQLKKNVLEPTLENIQMSIETDVLKRNELLAGFIQSLVDSEGGVCIALDGKWGSGKTFFVKQAQYVIEQKGDISNRYAGSYSLDKNQLKLLIPIYYDAWRNDDSIDPLLSIIYTILQESSHCIDNPWEKMPYKEIWPIIADGITKLSVSKIVRKIQDSSVIFSYFKNRDMIQDKIREMFTAIIESQRAANGIDDEIPVKIILFIDELDRCNPDFSIRLLERIKHYIDNDDVMFVFSVNLDELQHTISKFYGSDFSATSYLDRFFDVRLSLPAIDKRIQSNLIGYADKYALRSKVVESVMENFSFTLRERSRYISWCLWSRRYYDDNYYYGGIKLCSQIMVPYMIGLKMRNLHDYEDFIRGESCEKFVQFILESIEPSQFRGYFLSPEELMNGNWNSYNKRLLEKNLTDLYTWVWKNEVSSLAGNQISPDGDIVLIGNLNVYSTTATSLLDIIGLLG